MNPPPPAAYSLLLREILEDEIRRRNGLIVRSDAGSRGNYTGEFLIRGEREWALTVLLPEGAPYFVFLSVVRDGAPKTLREASERAAVAAEFDVALQWANSPFLELSQRVFISALRTPDFMFAFDNFSACRDTLEDLVSS